MPVQSLAPADGLSAAEVAHLVVFARRADLLIETSRTEDGSRYAALHVDTGASLRDEANSWVVSREGGRVTAFNETRGLLPGRRTIPDLLAELARLLPANREAPREVSFAG